MKINAAVMVLSVVGALGLCADPPSAAAAKIPVGVPGVSGGHHGGGKTKTGDYNDSASSDTGTGEGSQANVAASDPNNGMNAPGTTSDDDVARAAAAMDAAQKKVQRQFESSPDWSDASGAFDKAKAACDTARGDALRALKEKPEYVAGTDAATKATADLDGLRKTGTATPQEMTTAATAALNAKSAITKMEADACAADPAVTAAKAKLVQATAAMTQLRQKEHAAVLADADYTAAKEKFDAAKAKVATAQK